MYDYDDDYETCARTYATLCIYPGEIDPDAVTERLGIEPSGWQRRGETSHASGRMPTVATLNGWFLCSRGEIESRDSRRHIDWLLSQLMPKAEAVHSLQMMGCRMDISCYWLSQQGEGGPTLRPAQMRKLADLNIELWFDFYGPYGEDDD